MAWSSSSAGGWYGGDDATTTYVDINGKTETYVYVAKERRGYTIDQYHKLKADRLNKKVHDKIKSLLNT